jgi:hypothetical protein
MEQIYPAKDFSKEDELEFEWCEGTYSEAYMTARDKPTSTHSVTAASFAASASFTYTLSNMWEESASAFAGFKT